MKSTGKRFEENFKKSIPKEVLYYRFKDSTNNWGKNSNKIRFTSSNIADCMVYDGKLLFILELKSTKGKSLPISNVREHQIADLVWASAYKNVLSGFVIEFSDVNEVYFIDIKSFIIFFTKNKRKSLPIDYCAEKGTKIGVKKLRTNSRYDIEGFLNTSMIKYFYEEIKSVHCL